MSAGSQLPTPAQSGMMAVKIDIDAIIMQLLSVKDTPGKQVTMLKSVPFSSVDYFFTNL
jgi:hypothetical protein